MTKVSRGRNSSQTFPHTQQHGGSKYNSSTSAMAAPESSSSGLLSSTSSIIYTSSTSDSALNLSTSLGSQNSSTAHGRSNVLSAKAIAGVCIGTVLGLSTLFLVILFWIWRDRKAKMQRRLIDIRSASTASVELSPSPLGFTRKMVNSQYSNSSLPPYSDAITNSLSTCRKTPCKMYCNAKFGHVFLEQTSHNTDHLLKENTNNTGRNSKKETIFNIGFAPPTHAKDLEALSSHITRDKPLPIVIGTGVRRTERNSRNYSQHLFDKPLPSPTPLPFSQAYPLNSSNPATMPPNLPKPIKLASERSENIDMLASIKRSDNRMESLLAAMNIPISPVTTESDEGEQKKTTIYTSPIASFSGSNISSVGNTNSEIFPLQYEP